MRRSSCRPAAACAGLLALLGVLAGCASTPKPVPTERKGFIQKIIGDESDHPTSERAPAGDETPSDSKLKDLNLRWPLSHVQVTSRFGHRGKEFHEGVDLHAPMGTSVFASESGTVIYAGHRIRGYGNMLVIRHIQGFATVYAHNSKLLVRFGQEVKRGQKIAVSGKSGHAHGAHLHFEVRNGVNALDPETLLPPARSIASEKSD